MNHLKVINTLLMNGAEPVSLDAVKSSQAFKSVPDRNYIAAVLLMTGLPRFDLSHFPKSSSAAFFDRSMVELRRSTIDLANSYAGLRVTNRNIKSI